MALRVLLADESVTIKKVFQLALQDFAVEVTPVNVGLDVLQVASKIKPDIVFTDVLLQKKNGYEVCRELKNHPELGRIPVVLIWSGFMEFDEARFKSSGADAHLEKPFDTQRLRQLVQNLVNKTQSQPLSSFLTFPKLPDFDEPAGAMAPSPTRSAAPLTPRQVAPPANRQPAPPPTEKETSFFPPPPKMHPHDMSASPGATIHTGNTGSWSMDSFEKLEAPDDQSVGNEKPPAPVRDLLDLPDLSDEFISVDLPSEPPKPPSPKRKAQLVEDEPGEDEAQWVQKSLASYKLDASKVTPSNPSIKYTVPEEKIDPDTFISNTWAGKMPTEKKTSAVSSSKPPPTPPPRRGTPAPTPSVASVDDDDLLELDLHEEKKPGLDLAATQLNEKQLEAIIRAQSKEMIEKVIWQILPEIATRIIERELERLLAERKKP